MGRVILLWWVPEELRRQSSMAITQTDQRTDVYAIGQTMLYMGSESYEKNQLSECAVSRRMKKIIEKACSFEPDKRYGDAAQLRRAVEKCQANNRKKVYKKQAQSLD